MNEIDFNVLDNQLGPPSTLDTTSLPSQSTPFGLLHHQSAVDTFIIRAYNLLSNGAIINSNQFQSTVIHTPTTMHTPSLLISNCNPTMNTLTTNEELLKINENNQVLNNNENNNNNNNTPTTTININNNNNNMGTHSGGTNNSITNSNSNNDNIVSNSPDSISTFGSTNTLIHNVQHFNMQLFQKISSLHSAVISSSIMNDVIDKSSSSPKSAIELFQRFIQILKELELSFEASPYAKYFRRLDEHLWQIKNDSELNNDKLWQSITTCIFAVYDPQTGKIMNSNNIRVRKTVSNQSNNGNNNNNNNRNNIEDNSNQLIENNNTRNNGISITTTNTTTTTNNNNNNNSNVSNTPSSNKSNSDDKMSTTIISNNTSTDSTITSNAKSKKKYTRKKVTSTKQSTGKKTARSRIQKSTFRNNRNIQSYTNIADEIFFQQNQKQQIMPDSNRSKSINELSGSDGLLPQQLQRRLQSVFMNRDDHINISRSLNGYYTQPTSPGPGFDTNLDNNPQLDFNNLVSNGNQNPGFYNLNGPVINNMSNFDTENTINSNNINNWKNKSMDLNTFGDNEMDQMLQFNSNSNGSMDNNHNNNNNNVNVNMNNNSIVSTRQKKVDALILNNVGNQMKQAFEQIVQEKNRRILQLERELQTQKQETQWLRRMLIEDMGCVRSMLQDIKKD